MGPAVDRAGNVYVLDGSAGDVLEFPKIDGGYGPMIALAFAGPKIQDGYSSMTVDGSGDLFLGVNLSAVPTGVGEVIELSQRGIWDRLHSDGVQLRVGRSGTVNEEL